MLVFQAQEITITCSRTSHTSEQKMDKSKLITWERLELVQHTVYPSSIIRFSGSYYSCCSWSAQCVRLWLFTHRAKHCRFTTEKSVHYLLWMVGTNGPAVLSEHWHHSPQSHWAGLKPAVAPSHPIPCPSLTWEESPGLRKAFAFQKSNTANYLKYLSRALFHYS